VSHDLRADALARPRVRVNQVGYLPDGPQRATVVTDAVGPLPFAVVTDRGDAVIRGTTQPWPGVDASSGFAVHVVDLAGLPATDGALRVLVDDGGSGLASHPFRVSRDLWSELPRDALRFFLAQRSGIAITDESLPGYARPAGHVDVPPNRGDGAVPGWTGPAAEALYPGWQLRRPVDVTGGWYDAGDHGKYVTSGALPAALLLDAAQLCPPGDPFAAELLDEACWQVDWLVRMQVPPGEQHAGLAFHRVHDTEWTPLPLLPHEDPAPRVLHRPSTAAGLHLAAVAAQASRAVRDPALAARLLQVARTAYAAAGREPDLLAPPDDGAHGGGPYDDADLTDDRYWAAAELFLATGDAEALADLTASPCHAADPDDDTFDWNALVPWVRLRLSAVDGALPDGERAQVRDALLAAADRLRAVAATQPWGQPYAPDDGWDWGSSGLLLSALVVLAGAHEVAGRPEHRAVALAGLDHLMGRNATGISFVTGYGTESAHRQRARHFGHALDPAYPPPPRGSVAGGPASRTYPGFPGDPRFAGLPPQLCYVDEPTSETTNDVCIRWNAPLVWLGTWLTRRH
jgi:endoglucanase